MGREKRSRRWFLASIPTAFQATALAGSADTEKGRVFPPTIKRYADATTEFIVMRLTDPAYTSLLPPATSHPVAKRSNFLLFASDLTGRFQAFRMDLKSGQMRQLTDAAALDSSSLALDPAERGIFYYDANQLIFSTFSNYRTRTVYEIPSGFERTPSIGIAEDSQYAAAVERSANGYRLRLIHLATGEATTLAEAEEELRDPIPRPRRASILYRHAGAVWLADYDAKQNYRLRLAEGEIGPAQWSPDGRSVLYLNYPAEPHKLHNLREFTPDTNEDRAIADTSQFVAFDRNADASVFVGASGSKASPHVLLLVRSVKRELTLAEHRSTNPALVSPVFAPNSQRIFFGSDLHGKPAIYAMSVERFVEETAAN